MMTKKKYLRITKEKKKRKKKKKKISKINIYLYFIKYGIF